MNLRSALARAARMDAEEIRFRSANAARIAADRARHRIARPSWSPERLATLLDPAMPASEAIAAGLARHDTAAAQDRLSEHFTSRPSAWPIAAADRASRVRMIDTAFPAAKSDARARADRPCAGYYDLLGYRGLEYGPSPDWHRDPVHDRRAAEVFWADVPYLDPASGDHKIIWELNRHQHWLALGRAFWLTGDGRYAQACFDQLYAWLAANPPLHGINWASMLELAFRGLSWAAAIEFFAGQPDRDGRPWLVDLLAALDRQLDHVAHNLSRYFSPNTHLSGEALALYAVSLALPELRASSRRAALGRGVLLEEAQRQVLPDGAHAERSTHYHRYSTDFYLLATMVARRAGDPAAEAFAASARAQAACLRTLADDHGTLQMIGDDDGGQLFAMCGTRPADVRTSLAIAASLLDEPALSPGAATEEACWFLGVVPAAAAPEPWPSRLLPDAGYFVSRSAGQHAVLDAGPHGFLNAGHAHADALAVICGIDGRPLLVDPGTGTYTMDAALRDDLRSARLHNTLVLDRREPSTPHGPFHWAERTDARFLFARSSADCDTAQGVHDGYAGVRHGRTLFTIHGMGWLIVDQVAGADGRLAEAFWHMHPDWKVEPAAQGVRLTHEDGASAAILTTAERLEIVTEGPLARFAPEYGDIRSAPVLSAGQRLAGAHAAIATFIAASDEVASSTIRCEPAARSAGGWPGAAVSVRSEQFELAALVAMPWHTGDAWTAQPWGSDAVQSDGRAALAWRAAGSPVRTCVIEGTSVTAPAVGPGPACTNGLTAEVTR
jgi:hypothetical protein